MWFGLSVLLLGVLWFIVLVNGGAKGLIWKVPVFAIVTRLLLGLAWRLLIGMLSFAFTVGVIALGVIAILAIGHAIFKEA